MALKIEGQIRGYFQEEGERLSPTAFLIWVFLLCEQEGALPFAQVSLRRIARKTGIRSRATISRALDELVAKGMISKIKADTRNLCNLYVLRSQRDRAIDTQRPAEKILENEFFDQEI